MSNILPEQADTDKTAQSVSSRQRWFHLSIKSLMVITAMCAIALIVVFGDAVREANAVASFTGPNVDGKLDKFEPRSIAKITPLFVQEMIGEKYFQTATSANVNIYLNKHERQLYDRAQSPQLAIQTLSRFTNLKFLGLDFGREEPDNEIDLRPLANCEKIRQLEISGASTHVVKEIAKHAKTSCLVLNGCTLDDQMIDAIAKSKMIRHLQFNFCTVKSHQIIKLKSMAALESIHFFQMDLSKNQDHSFDLNFVQTPGGLVVAEPDVNKVLEGQNWFAKTLPGVEVTGLGSVMLPAN